LGEGSRRSGYTPLSGTASGPPADDQLGIADWVRQILAAAGHDAELVTVPDADVPDDMDLTKHYAQHLLFDSHKAQVLLGCQPGPPEAGIAASVRWHLANPPDSDGEPDFTADDCAPATAPATQPTA
jgi:hypothetical protein